MILNAPASFAEAIAALQKAGKLPNNLTAQQVTAIQKSLQKYAGDLSKYSVDKIMEQIKSSLLSILNPQQLAREGAAQPVEVGYNPATAQTAIADLAAKLGADDLAEGFLQRMISIATDVARGAGRYITQNADPDEVDAIPALALTRVYERDVPRGFKAGRKGTLIPVPDDDWPSRWAEAGEASADEDWLPWEGDSQTGRGVALKASDIWNQLGNLRDDSLGNPFPPFAFNSGFDVDGVSRAECEALGLLDKGEKADGAELNLAELFAPIA